MKYLLDVNALLAWRHARAPMHRQFHAWVAKVGVANLATCAHVELGFLRVSMQVFGYTLPEAQAALREMKTHLTVFIEHAPSPSLSPWAKTAAQTSDAYLAQLAAANGLKLATFDKKIPGSTQIPD
ncbi:type II toxin-antitoxin system VapC family toxin [Nibricoccus sp. IMCC34717]|uniref:type II toxin-antitoxin system VapC family toxin n=1 Tax=Nibricoccus sp. IMCC34717 TaxID=3034021 RepID=UPI00384DA550